VSATLRCLRALLADDAGTALVEYALVLALISIGAVAALSAAGDQATQALDGAAGALTNAGQNPP
jgi:Flp pilus assembly pilin Flp